MVGTTFIRCQWGCIRNAYTVPLATFKSQQGGKLTGQRTIPNAQLVAVLHVGMFGIHQLYKRAAFKGTCHTENLCRPWHQPTTYIVRGGDPCLTSNTIKSNEVFYTASG